MMNNQFQISPRVVSKSGHSRWQKKHALPAKDSALEGNSSQHTSFDQFIETIKLQMQPEGRAQHTAGMFQHLRTLLPNDVTLADLVAGWQVLAQPPNDTNSEVLHRRKPVPNSTIERGACQFSTREQTITLNRLAAFAPAGFVSDIHKDTVRQM